MNPTTTLLIAADPAVVKEVRSIHDDLDHARFELCGRLDKVPAALERAGIHLLLIDDCPSMEVARIRAALETADRLLIRAAVVRVSGGDCQPRDFAPFHRYQLPADARSLAELIRGVRAAAANTLYGPTAPAPVDPIAASLLGNDLTHQLDTIRRVARQGTAILLTGETGSGKSLIAKFIHANSPQRADPYLVVDCGALSDHLVESEMFGHVRGAYTGADRDRQGKFAAAGVGTLVLDEVNSLPMPLQAKLLRAVEERVFEPVGSNKVEQLRARLVAVSNVPLEDEVRRERFRKDLYYRLNVVEFRIPSLRERPGSIIPLAHHLLQSSATAACQGVTAMSAGALEAMIAYPWPGNVRELRNVIEGAAAMARGPVIQFGDLPESIRGRRVAPLAPGGASPESTVVNYQGAEVVPLAPDLSRPEIPTHGGDEATRLMAILRKHNNNRRRAAAELGISRVSLYKKLHKAGLFVRKQVIGPGKGLPS